MAEEALAKMRTLEQEYNRLAGIEARLIAAWQSAYDELETELGLLRCGELRSTMRKCEIYLGYVPKVVEKDANTPKE